MAYARCTIFSISLYPSIYTDHSQELLCQDAGSVSASATAAGARGSAGTSVRTAWERSRAQGGGTVKNYR